MVKNNNPNKLNHQNELKFNEKKKYKSRVVARFPCPIYHPNAAMQSWTTLEYLSKSSFVSSYLNSLEKEQTPIHVIMYQTRLMAQKNI